MMSDEMESKTSRERVLRTLLRRERCTIKELAEAVEINPISVRHHIGRLEAEGLVTSIEERHGVGRPRRLYFLTESGRESFPTRYVRLTLRLLEQLKETMPQPVVERLFSQMAQEMASDYQATVNGMPIEQRLDLLAELLSQEGFTADWVKQGGHYQIRESNCPYYHIRQIHPEVCMLGQTLIATLLSTPVHKIQCMLDGDANCTYLIPDIETAQ
ncbi:MAG: winged helix-turn-helix transcriptional regulator [Anaerolineales bacterium]|nr:winged helix-turn-helix transcriptional regulator [Anaerolineales bacterium]